MYQLKVLHVTSLMSKEMWPTEVFFATASVKAHVSLVWCRFKKIFSDTFLQLFHEPFGLSSACQRSSNHLPCRSTHDFQPRSLVRKNVHFFLAALLSYKVDLTHEKHVSSVCTVCTIATFTPCLDVWQPFTVIKFHTCLFFRFRIPWLQ